MPKLAKWVYEDFDHSIPKKKNGVQILDRIASKEWEICDATIPKFIIAPIPM